MRRFFIQGAYKLYNHIYKLKEELERIRIRELNENRDESWRDVKLEEMELSVRAFNCLKRAGVHNVWDLMNMSMFELKQVRNLGKKSRDEVVQKLLELLAAPATPVKTEESKTQSESEAEKGADREHEEETAVSEGGDNEDDFVPIGIYEEAYYETDDELADELADENARDPYEKLDTLIGLENVKKQVRRIAAFARLKKEMEKEKPGKKLNLNMEFLGNPGTAKTTVARIMAEILYKEGITTQRRLYEVGRADLVGRYVGETAHKVANVFRDAEGAVLFIDEAYSLVDEQTGSYGDEAINTMVQEMENRVGDTIVILAGYPERMEGIYERNPGLRSRVPFSIAFDDYSPGELLQIAVLEAEKHGFTFSVEAEDFLREGFGKMAADLSAGNGRICRNIVEDAILNYAERIYGKAEGAEGADRVITEADIVFPEAPVRKKKQRIGFAA